MLCLFVWDRDCLCSGVSLRQMVFVFVFAVDEAELGLSSQRECDRCGLVCGSHTNPRSTCEICILCGTVTILLVTFVLFGGADDRGFV